MTNNRYNILDALDAFIRKYYKNLLIKGVLYTVGIITTLFLVTILLEHFGWLSSTLRGILFWGGLTAVATTVIILIAKPLVKMHGLGKRIERSDAAKIIGRYFPEVSDKLLNLLQLVECSDSQMADESNELLLAAIAQKTEMLKPVPLLNAINLKANSKYLKYAIPPLIILIVLLIAAPSVVTEPTKRIANYTTTYERPAPFRFVILNNKLQATQGEDYTLSVQTQGSAIPEESYIIVSGRKYKMSRKDDIFEYTFTKVQRTETFSMEGGGVKSAEYQLEVLLNPTILSFRMLLSYPAYTGRENETIHNIGDAVIPEGTTVKWLFQTQSADSMAIESDAWAIRKTVDKNGRVETSRRILETTNYTISTMNANGNSNAMDYSLSVVADASPMITVEEYTDSLYPERKLFRGKIKDDYGFSKLVFTHKTTDGTDSVAKASNTVELALGNGTSQDFYFSFNTAEVILEPGDRLVFYFEVSDNDAIHGPKKARSQQFEIKIPSLDEIDDIMEKNSSEAQKSASEQLSELQRLQEEINELSRKLVNKKELNWQDKKDLEQIAKKQKQVQQLMKQMQQQINENNHLEQKYREQSEKLMEKQRELDRLMNEIMDEKMKETMAEIDRMMQELDKKKVQQELEKLKMNNEDLERQLDQNLELMKRLELEKKVEQTIQKLDKLADKQREAAKETEQAGKKDKDKLNEKQQSLNEEFKQLKQDINDIKKDYKEIDPSVNFKVPDELQKNVEEHQKEAQESIQNGKNKDAGKQQKQAADDMEKLSDAIAEAQLDAEQEDLAEDAEEVRQLLKNLVKLSFNQEELISDLNNTFIQDPRYQTIIARQSRIRDDFRSTADSLQKMAKRQIQIASAITKEASGTTDNIQRSLNGLLDMNQSYYGTSRNTSAARTMQYSMTSLNNLALILAESLDKMEQQMRMNAQKKKSGQCKNTGKSNQQCNNPGKKPSPKSMRQMQQELNKQMEALKKQLDKQGKQKNGRHQLGQGQTMSEEFAKMAAQQEMIRRMMQEYGTEMKSASGGDSKLAKEIDQIMKQMEQTETDLVNRTITQQTINRQQQIMSRLLQHERAEMEREKEERRESHEAKDIYSQPSPAELNKYNKQSQQGKDQLKTIPPTLYPFYREKTSEYFYEKD